MRDEIMKRVPAVVALLAMLFSSATTYAGAPIPNPDVGGATEASFQESTAPFYDSSAAIGAASGDSAPLFIATIVIGGVAAVAGSTMLTVREERVKKENILRLQDQIYLAEGKDYQDLLDFFELDDRDLVKANDELVIAGYQVVSDQAAADYLAALIQKLAERSQKAQYQMCFL
jgi:hypothetical protein